LPVQIGQLCDFITRDGGRFVHSHCYVFEYELPCLVCRCRLCRPSNPSKEQAA
jgi:hypothetical protein